LLLKLKLILDLKKGINVNKKGSIHVLDLIDSDIDFEEYD